MTFRGRLLVGFLVVVLVPLAVLALGVRTEMRKRELAQTERRAQVVAGIIAADLADAHTAVGSALSAIATGLADDPAFRAGVLRGEGLGRGYVIDYAAPAMRASNLAMLQIRDDSGRILSSGHFPAEFDRVDTALPAALSALDEPALVATTTAEGTLLTIARVDSVRIGGRVLTVIGGHRADQRFLDRLAAGDETGVILTLPDTTLASTGAPPAPPFTRGAALGVSGSGVGDSASGGGRPEPGGGARSDQPGSTGVSSRVVRAMSVPFLDATGPGLLRTDAEFAIVRSLDEVARFRRSIDRWLIATFLLASVAAVLAALWTAARLSRPMEELAQATSIVDLDRLDVRFATSRDDEIGVLSRRLSAMVDRLRGSTARLRDAERRAAVGDIARQVNHDIKNGLAPIRNVVRHLAEVARDQPQALPAIFAERQGTLESSITYLDTLARNYARLSPSLAASASDPASVIADAVAGVEGRGATVRTRCAPTLPRVAADAVVLRRIIENLVANAVDSLEGKPGEVIVSADHHAHAAQPMIRITVADSGRGMSEAELGRAFDDFYTTKPNGTGLGLSVVRRLVADLGGALRVETEPGVGTQVVIELPAATPRPSPTQAAAHR